MVRWLAALIAASLFPASVAADPPPRVTFDQALGLAHELPALVAMRDAARQERALALPRPWQPLTLTLTPRARLAPSELRNLEGSIAVQQAIPLDDVNSARRAVLDARADARKAAAAATTLDSRLDAAAAWIAAWAAQERLTGAERERDLARSIVEVTERGLAAGVFTAPELADARAFLAEAEVRLLDAEGGLADAGFALARAVTRPGSLATEGALPEAPLPDADATGALIAHARAMPAVAARQLAARAARARAAEERASRGRQLIVGGEALKDGPGAWAAGVTLGLALPHDRGQREAREAELEARIAEAEAAQLIAHAASELASALHEVAHTGEVLARLRDQLVPAADDAAARRGRAVEIGESTVVELLTSRRTALAARARLADARAAHAWARVRAWLLLEAAEAAR